jgi:hypothetical protein
VVRATQRRRQDEARAMRSEGNARQRGGGSERRAMRSEGDTRQRGGGSERRELSTLEKEKRNDAPGVCSVAPRIYGQKGRSIVKKKRDNPPRGLPVRGSSYVPVKRKAKVSGNEKKKGKVYMHRCWGAQCVTWQMWHCLGMFPRLTL